MIKTIFTILLCLGLCIQAEAKCINGSSYVLKGYLETDAGVPVTAKALNEVLFDIFYDDGSTASTGNVATAEMGQGVYRYSYTSNGKNGWFVMRDSTSVNRNFPGGVLEIHCDSQVFTPNTDGSVKTAGVITGTASASSTTVDLIDALGLVSTQPNAYVGWVVLVDGESSVVKAFDSATDKITLSSPLSASAANKVYILVPESLAEIITRVRRIR